MVLKIEFTIIRYTQETKAMTINNDIKSTLLSNKISTDDVILSDSIVLTDSTMELSIIDGKGANATNDNDWDNWDFDKPWTDEDYQYNNAEEFLDDLYDERFMSNNNDDTRNILVESMYINARYYFEELSQKKSLRNALEISQKTEILTASEAKEMSKLIIFLLKKDFDSLLKIYD